MSLDGEWRGKKDPRRRGRCVDGELETKGRIRALEDFIRFNFISFGCFILAELCLRLSSICIVYVHCFYLLPVFATFTYHLYLLRRKSTAH